MVDHWYVSHHRATWRGGWTWQRITITSYNSKSRRFVSCPMHSNSRARSSSPTLDGPLIQLSKWVGEVPLGPGYFLRNLGCPYSCCWFDEALLNRIFLYQYRSLVQRSFEKPIDAVMTALVEYQVGCYFTTPWWRASWFPHNSCHSEGTRMRCFNVLWCFSKGLFRAVISR